MDPISIIIAALIAGAAAGTTDAAKTAITDAYDSLKSKLRRASNDDPESEALVVRHVTELAPSSETALREQLVRLGVANDPAIVEAARTVLARVEAHDSASLSQWSVSGDVQGVVQSNFGTVEMNFGVKKPRNES